MAVRDGATEAGLVGATVPVISIDTETRVGGPIMTIGNRTTVADISRATEVGLGGAKMSGEKFHHWLLQYEEERSQLRTQVSELVN